MTVKSLYAYQETAVSEISESLSPQNAIVLVAPTGSGKTIMAARVAANFKRVLFVAHRRELIQQAREEMPRNVRCMSVNAALTCFPRTMDLVIIDEAHRATAPTYRQVVKRYAGASLLGLTATPLRMDGVGLCDIFNQMVQASSISELIAAGHLVSYVALEAPDEALKQLDSLPRKSGDWRTRDLSAIVDRPRLVGNIVREYLKHGRGRSAVAFAVSRNHSRALTAEFVAQGVRAEHLDGKASERIRDGALARLRRGEIDVLCNVNLFTEGWDCPPVSCVIMARPTASLTLHLQAIGRGLRKHGRKRNLLILDHAGNIERHGPPDKDRIWSLESELQRQRREREAAELDRIFALGFNSLEAYDLEQKRKRRNSYSHSECGSLLGLSGCPLTHILRKHVKGQFGFTAARRYPCEQVDALVEVFRSSYSRSEAWALLGKTPGRFLLARGVKAVFGQYNSSRYSKQEIDSLVASLSQPKYSLREVQAILGMSRNGLVGQNGDNGFFAEVGLENVGLTNRELMFSKAKVDQIAERLKASIPLAECYQVLGLSSGRATKVIKKSGIAPTFNRPKMYPRDKIMKFSQERPRNVSEGMLAAAKAAARRSNGN